MTCHKQIKKQQTSIRCNHTHNTHWVNLNCTHIKQRQYKPDWRCTIYTPTQIVTKHAQTTQQPITDKSPPNHSQTTINQRPKHHQININGIRNKIEELKNLVHNTQPDIITINNNIIPHTWKLANIIPIPKPNKDMNIGTSYRPSSLLSVIAKHWRSHYSHTSQTTSHTSPHNMASKATTLLAQNYTT